MLKKNPQAHLSDDDMLRALVDAADLGMERRSHLDQCDECQKGLVLLEQGFDRLGKSARRLTPAPARSFRLPHKVSKQRWWHLTPMWASGIAAAIALAFVLWLPRQVDRTAHNPNLAISSPTAADSLLDQVDSLIDDPLPPVLQQMAIPTDWDDSGNVIDWVVPPVDNMDDEDDYSWT